MGKEHHLDHHRRLFHRCDAGNLSLFMPLWTTDDSPVALQSVEEVCLDRGRKLHPGCHVRLAEHQGGCSVTMIVAERHDHYVTSILQIRPQRFAVDVRIMQLAREVLGSVVPTILDVVQQEIAGHRYQMLSMSLVPGLRLTELQAYKQDLDISTMIKLEKLVVGMADIFAGSWHHPVSMKYMTGKIGTSVGARLSKLQYELPCDALRRLASKALRRLATGELECLPVVLTHGDLIPSNILVDPATGKLTGLVDWAEAEYLPFGMSLYGLEHLLSYLHTGRSNDCCEVIYHVGSRWLRACFWRRLEDQIPVIGEYRERKAVVLARIIGVLLWFGFAWDDGKIDRVVDNNKAEEIVRLRAYLADELADSDTSSSL